VKPPKRQNFGGKGKAKIVRPKQHNHVEATYSQERFRKVVDGFVTPQMSHAEAALAMSMMDPGHSSNALQNACPFPDGIMREVVMLPLQTEFELTVAAGATFLLYVPNHPLIACIYAVQGAGTYFAVPHTGMKSSSMPGRYLIDNHIGGIRALGKSLTTSNTTPVNDRGGSNYANAWPLPLQIRNFATSEGAVITALANNPTLHDVPLTQTAFLQHVGFFSTESEGIYAEGRPMSWEKNSIVGAGSQLNANYGPGSGPILSANAQTNAFAITASSIDDNAPVAAGNLLQWDSALTGYIVGSSVVMPVLVDGFDTFGTCITTPSTKAQTYKFKICCLFECSVLPSITAMVRTVQADENEYLVKKIKGALDTLPRFFPSSYNGMGVVWQWFKKYYQKKGQKLGPLIGNLPMIGPVVDDLLADVTAY